MNKEYKFTENWFAGHDLEKFLPLGSGKELHILEIGSFEGKSTIWFLDNLLVNKKSTITCIDPWTRYSQDEDSFNSYNKEETEWDFRSNYETFIHNIGLSGKWDQVLINKGYSYDILPRMISEGKKYDIIFIDGNHTSPFVLSDGVMGWYLLKEGGIMIFDDYLFGEPESTNYPKIAIDSFINIFKDYTEVIWDEWRKAVKKIK